MGYNVGAYSYDTVICTSSHMIDYPQAIPAHYECDYFLRSDVYGVVCAWERSQGERWALRPLDESISARFRMRPVSLFRPSWHVYSICCKIVSEGLP